MHIPEYTVILKVHIVVKTPILCSFSFIFTYAIQSCVLCPYVLAVFACVQLSKRRKAEYVKTVHIHSCFSGLLCKMNGEKKLHLTLSYPYYLLKRVLLQLRKLVTLMPHLYEDETTWSQ